MNNFVGIDLGTTFSVVAYIKDGKPEVIPNNQGKRITPSVIDLGSNPPLVGDDAKEKQALGDEQVYAFFKRDMGNPHALYLENNQEYTPIDLSSMVLSYLKHCAEDFLGQSVTDAVITVPAYFNNMQREATIEAGKKAGFNILRIINEPTAAAIAYGVRPNQNNSKILVYDLGGGTFDVSLVEVTGDELRVIATDGDHILGGKDWDDRILQFLATQFEEDFGVELMGEDFNELMILAEKTKISLSTKQAVKVSVKGGGHQASYEITRQQFEQLTKDLIERTQMLVNIVLDEANLTWKDIEGAVLVGGSTRMPMVREYVEEMSGKLPLSGVNPDEAVALGAAIQAAIDIEAKQQKNPQLFLSGKTQSTETLLLGGVKKSSDVISHSLGMIAVSENGDKYINSIIISKNQPIPSQQTRPYQFRVKKGEENKLEVFMTQGETLDPMSCVYLGNYVFTDIPMVNSRLAIIDITYSYNLSGVVEVSAVERSTQKPLTLTIEPVPLDVPDDRFTKSPQETVVREHLNIYMAFDLSGSMNGRPLNEAIEAAKSFVTQCDLTTTSIGIIEFSDKTLTTVNSSQNIRKINHGIQNLSIGRTGYGNSAHPFDEIFRILRKAKDLKYGIILTDGVWANQQ
jgi:molecular chaperone DnaK